MIKINSKEMAMRVRRQYMVGQAVSGAKLLGVLVLIGGITVMGGLSFYEQRQLSALDDFVKSQAQQSVAQAGVSDY